MSTFTRWASGVGTAALLILIPAILPTILIHLSTEILIFALFAVSFNQVIKHIFQVRDIKTF